MGSNTRPVAGRAGIARVIGLRWPAVAGRRSVKCLAQGAVLGAGEPDGAGDTGGANVGVGTGVGIGPLPGG